MIITNIYQASTPQRMAAYQICAGIFTKSQQGNPLFYKMTLTGLASSLISYAKGQGVKPTLGGMDDYYNQVSGLVNTEAKIEVYFKTLSKPGLMQKGLNKLLDLAGALSKRQGEERAPTDIKLATALASIISIYLLSGNPVSIYLPNETIHLNPPE